jgi:hypothetical protein
MKKKWEAIWKNKKQIIEGITNTIIRDGFVEDIAKHRMDICNACPRKDEEGKYCLVPGTKPCCNLCGCSLQFKTRSLSSDCPDLKWPAVLTEEEEDKLDNLKD